MAVTTAMSNIANLALEATLLRRSSRCQEPGVRPSSMADRATTSGASLLPASTRGSAEESTLRQIKMAKWLTQNK